MKPALVSELEEVPRVVGDEDDSGLEHWVERCWPTRLQARRSETSKRRRRWPTASRLRAGLTIFPPSDPSASMARVPSRASAMELQGSSRPGAALLRQPTAPAREVAGAGRGADSEPKRGPKGERSNYSED